jgi:uncharacterized protein (DUF2235 family)
MALFAFDGTNQDDRDAGSSWAAVSSDTNIYRFYSAYQGYVAGTCVNCDYVPGVGTRFGVLGRAIGGAFGVGWLDRVSESYDALCAGYEQDPLIDVIGFSRGAAMALDFVNKIADRGIVVNGRTIAARPAVRFVGLFDVVSAFGVASLGGALGAVDPIHEFDLPDTVAHCFHAMALDERRTSFINRRVAGAYEVWFRGVHSDIGGGNDNPGLEYVALRWMFRKAIASGLPVTEANITDSAVHPELPIKPNPLSKASPYWRTVLDTDLIHYSVSQHPILPGEECNRLPAAHYVETLDDEKTRLDPPPLT